MPLRGIAREGAGAPYAKATLGDVRYNSDVIYNSKVNRHLLTIAVVIFVLAPAVTGEQITFHEAVTLAIKNAKAVSIAHADGVRVRNAYQEARSAYIPQVSLGSGLGYTFGFPLGTPSIFSVNSASMLYNPAQREYIKAAKFEITASDMALADKRQQAILDTAIAYADLDRHQAALEILKSGTDEAARAYAIVQQRVQAGVEAAVEETRAKLTLARLRLKQSQTESEADLLRLRLSQLTGVSASGLSTAPDSMPRLPAPPVVDEGAAANDAAVVKAAQNDAAAKDRAALAEHKQLYPQVNLGGQYAMFSNAINNYSQYYRNFQRNNIAFGLDVKIPIFNAVQRAKYREALADASKAHAVAEDTRDQVSDEILRLERASQQLAQAQEIAELEFQLAQSDTAAVRTRNESGQASPKDLANSLVAEEEKRGAMLDARFNYQQARLQLMRLTGDIEGWAKAGGAPAP